MKAQNSRICIVAALCALFISVSVLSACGGELIPNIIERLFGDAVKDYTSREDEIFINAVQELLDAIAAGDADAVSSCFAADQRGDELDAEIERLLEVYPGETERWSSEYIQLHGEYSSDYGERTSTVDDIVVLVSGGEYYWLSVTLCYENDPEPDGIGIVSAALFSDDYYCALIYDLGVEFPLDPGLHIRTDYTLDNELIVINSRPLIYSPSAALDEDEVAEFLRQNDSLDDFIARFGNPCAENIYCYYELPDENGEGRYLVIGDDDRDRTIYSASVYDEFGWLYSVWHEDD